MKEARSDDEGEVAGWFNESLDELTREAHDVNVDPQLRHTVAQTKAAVLQARVAYEISKTQEELAQVTHDTAKSQEKLTANLVKATWGLVAATLIVALVAMWDRTT